MLHIGALPIVKPLEPRYMLHIGALPIVKLEWQMSLRIEGNCSSDTLFIVTRLVSPKHLLLQNLLIPY